MIYKKLSLLIAVFSFAVAASAQVNPKEKGDLSALFFGDYYWFVTNHNQDIEGNTGFWIRRIYLTYDYQISESFSGRVRLEMASEGDLTTESVLIPEVKDAWLRYSYGQHQIMAGIAPTPTWDLVETVWGYRSVAQSPLDLQDMGSSRGLGVSLKGEIGNAERLGYHFMVANGNGSATELNEGKKLMLAVSYQLSEHLVAQVYGDYEFLEANEYIYTLQGFVGYQNEAFNLGALYAYQWQSLQTITRNIVSVFTNFDISETLRGYLRADHTFEAYPFGDEISYFPFSDEAQSTFIIGGVDIQLHPKVSLLPNAGAIFYGENERGVSPHTDLIARLTLFFTL